MSTRFLKARFHKDFGPASLFERVLFKMQNVHMVKRTSEHFKVRFESRHIPDIVLKKIDSFNVNEWNLVTCEVRCDSGKFVNSTWEYICENDRYWLTIGFGNVAETIVKKQGLGKTNIITSGILFDFVDKVNSLLMENEVSSLHNP